MEGLSRFGKIKNDIGQNHKAHNFSLIFNKFPQFDGGEKKYSFYQKGDKNKSASFVGNTGGSKNEYHLFNKQFVAKIASQYQKDISDLGYHFLNEPLIIKSDYRLVVGLGTESIYETSMTLHHIYGFPYIPATAVKGIAHHFATENGFDEKEIFGSNDENDPSQGKVVFFDVMPIGEIILSPDIMNNHYPDYYDNGNKPPADWQSPRPIIFLTLKNTKFQFNLAVKRQEDLGLLNKAKEILEVALQNKGIGAKTAVGYGYMKPI